MCVNLLADVFIQYTQGHDHQSQEDFQQFSLLWLQFMKVMLSYFDQAKEAETVFVVNESGASTEAQFSQPLQQSIQENLQRVIAFLLDQKILVQPEEGGSVAGERVELYLQSKGVIGVFW